MNLDLLTRNIVSYAQTPSPLLTIGHTYSPYSRLATDPVVFACSFTYSSTYYTSSGLTYLYLDFKFASSSTTTSSSDTLLATIQWISYAAINSGTYTTAIPNSYSNRVKAAVVSDSGSIKNYSITLGLSTNTLTPNYYTTTDTGYYYCAIRDSYTTQQTGNFVQLSAYCML